MSEALYLSIDGHLLIFPLPITHMVKFIPLSPKGFEVVYAKADGIYRMRVLEAKTTKIAFEAAKDFLNNLGFEETAKNVDFGDYSYE